MNTRLTLILAFAVVMLAAPTFADTPDGNLRVMFSSASPSGSFSTDFDIGGGTLVPAEIEADSTTAFGLFYEVRVGDRWGVESGVYFADFDFDVKASGQSVEFGSSFAIPLTFGADFHAYQNDHVDIYFGPQVAYTFWGNLDGPFGTAEVDGDFGFGAVAGFDFRPGKSNWTINLAARYLGSALSDPSIEIDVDPLFVEFGFGYRF